MGRIKDCYTIDKEDLDDYISPLFEDISDTIGDLIYVQGDEEGDRIAWESYCEVVGGENGIQQQ